MIFQGFRDTLFTFNNAYNNYQCLASEGGDVRLLSDQYGHNALQVVPDPGVLLYQPAGDFLDTNCGNINVDTATIAFFDEYLKGIPGAANAVIPTQPCLSLTKGDGVLVDSVMTGHSGTEVDIPSTTVVASGPIDVPVAIPLNITAGTNGDVIGGIPRLEVDVEDLVAGTPGEPIIFVGIGQTHNGVPGVYDRVDNQITPLRGVGEHDVDTLPQRNESPLRSDRSKLKSAETLIVGVNQAAFGDIPLQSRQNPGLGRSARPGFRDSSQNPSSGKALRDLRPAVRLAEKVGEGLG